MNNTLVSIIMPAYNSEYFLPDTIESIINQTFGNWALIVIDYASKDDWRKINRKYENQSQKVNLISMKNNNGPAVSRNAGIEVACGRYIAFLDSDDMWIPEKLEKQLAFMNRNDLALSYTAYHTIDGESGAVTGIVHAPEKVDYRELLKQNTIGCLTAMYDTQKLGKIYMPDILKRQDFALWLDILKRTPYAMGLNEPLAYYRQRSDSLSSNKIGASLYNWKLYREVEKLPLYKAIYYFGWYTYKILGKYYGFKKRKKI